MVVLEINNSFSRIKGLSTKQEKELRELLSYTVGGSSAFFGRGYVRKKSLLDKYGNFPTGLLHRVLDWTTQHRLGVTFLDSREFPVLESPKKLDFTPFDWQSRAFVTALLKIRGIISAPTGTGKSNVIKMISNLFKKTLIIVPTLEIKKQLKDNLQNWSVTVENIDSKALNNLTDFDCLIIDEGHHVAAKTYHKLNRKAWNAIPWRFFLTATPFRNDSEEQLLFESIAGEVIYRLDYQTAVEERYIVPIEAYYIEVDKQKTDAYTYREVYSELVVNNVDRNTSIINMLTNLHASGKSTLCLVREVKHGKILSDITGLPFVSGEDDESRKYIRHFNNGGIKVLIGTAGILGEGIDTKPCEYVIIAGLGKAKSQFMQQIGRAVRTYPGKESAKVIIIKDASHKFTLRHFKEQQKILLQEYGIIPIRLG